MSDGFYCPIYREMEAHKVETQKDLPYERRMELINECTENCKKNGWDEDACNCLWAACNGGPGAQ